MLKRVTAVLATWLFALLPSFGAVTATTTHYVRTDGAAGNGGCFDPTVTVPGTNYSDQTGVQVSFTDLLIAADEFTASSVLNPITSAMVGNCFNITAGATCTVQRAVLLSQSGGVGTFNADLGTVGGACTAAMGGARGTGIQAAEAAVIAGNTVYVKATATYSITATQTYSTAGTVIAPIRYIAYTSTIADGGQVTVDRTSGTLSMFNITGAFRSFKGFKTTNAISRGFLIAATNVILDNCKSDAFTVAGFEINSSGDYATLINCWATNGTSAATAGFSVPAGGTLSSAFYSCQASGNACPGFIDASTSTHSRTLFQRCISANNVNGGSTTVDGFRVSGATLDEVFMNCVAYANGGAGIMFTGANTADSSSIVNSVLVSNGTYGINSDTTNYTNAVLMMNFNAFYNNTSGPRNNVPVGASDVTLSGDPFTSSSNFLPISSGAGLQLAAGFPGAMQFGGTGFLYIGPIQPTASGGSGGQKGYTWVGQLLRREQLRRVSNPEMWALLHPTFQAGISWPPPIPGMLIGLGLAAMALGWPRKRK